jgi:transposase-like protein
LWVQEAHLSIAFYDQEGKKYWVNTTIWSVDEHLITLKGGQVIPIKAIESIQF